MGCWRPASRSWLNLGRPARFSAIHSSANAPERISARICFISALTASLTIRGPRVRSPYSAVSEMENRMPEMPFSYIRSTISLTSCRHSKYADSGW